MLIRDLLIIDLRHKFVVSLGNSGIDCLAAQLVGEESMSELDSTLFYWVNISLSNGFFDWCMPTITDLHKNKAFVFIVLPLILGTWAFRKKWSMIGPLVGLLICVGAADNLTYRVLKPSFKRQRPPNVESELILRTTRFSGYSFPSNHAANNFAGAAFLSLCYPALTPALFTVAGLIAFSRVYVGVHYPGDVLAGALLGLILGLSFFRLWDIILVRLVKRYPHLKHATGNTAGVQNGKIQ